MNFNISNIQTKRKKGYFLIIIIGLIYLENQEKKRNKLKNNNKNEKRQSHQHNQRVLFFVVSPQNTSSIFDIVYNFSRVEFVCLVCLNYRSKKIICLVLSIFLLKRHRSGFYVFVEW